MEKKAVLVSRHELLPAQKKAIEKAGLEIKEVVTSIPNDPKELTQWCVAKKQEDVEAIITVALPPHLLATLSRHFELYILKMKQVCEAKSEKEALEWVTKNNKARTYLPGKPGEPIRLLEFDGLYRVKVIIEEERVA